MQANLEYLYEKYEDSCTIYRGDICDVDFIGNEHTIIATPFFYIVC